MTDTSVMQRGLPAGVEIRGEIKPGYERILTPEALTFVAGLQRKFGPERERLLSRRKDVQAKIMTAVNLNSRRKDVPVVDPSRAVDWSRYKDYVSGQSEDLNPAMAGFKQISRDILK